MDQGEIDRFEERVGLRALRAASPAAVVTGVAANWDGLPRALGAETEGFELEQDETTLLEPGLVRRQWIWKRAGEHIGVSVFVTGQGPAGARAQMVRLVSTTMRRDIPHKRGPSGLGDAAAELAMPPYHALLWVFHNICVEVGNAATGAPIEPVARAVQRFMAPFSGWDLAGNLPKVAGIDVAPPRVRVDEPVEISVRLAPGTRVDTLAIAIRELVTEHDGWRLIAEGDAVGGRAKLRGRKPGTARVQAMVAHRATLLSPPLEPVTVEVLPADGAAP